ncbi:MAG: DPP IV N-terminal domain-containing protein [candidate division WOR-3 bacterium]
MTYFILFYFAINQFLPVPKFDPKLKWYTLETDHFSIHFASKSQSDDAEELSRQIAWYCENAYRSLSPFMRWIPKGKTNVVIADVFDYVSGWATPFPNNLIFLSPTFPKDMRVNYNDWLKHLIIHEYTHILHMDMVFGFPRFLRKILGRIVLPNVTMPLCFHEGFSVFNETEFTGQGRCQSTYHRMQLRTAVLEKNLFFVDKCVTYELAQFPGAETPYLYGGEFYAYLAKRYCKDKLVDYSKRHSSGLPLFINYRSKQVFGRSIYSLWRDWHKDIINEYQTEIESIRQRPLTNSTRLTNEGFYLNSPIFSQDGNQIYYLSQNSHEFPSIKVLDLIENKTKTLLKRTVSSPLNISADGTKLIFSIREVYQRFYVFDDIYIYDLTTKRLNRVTYGLRASDPDISPDGTKIIFVGNELGQTNLFLMDLNTQEITQLTHSDGHTQYANPRFSPDDKKICVTIWKQGGLQDIYLFNLETGWLTPVTQDENLDIQPCWSSDAEYILFSSDRSGVFNIYAYHLKQDKTYQITNVLTGAFQPTISPDNQQLAFLLYSSKGYEIHLMDINLDSLSQDSIFAPEPLNAPSYIQKEKQLALDNWYTLSDTIRATLYYYNPFPSVLPKFWLPLVQYNNSWSIGALTYGADALFQHSYLIYGLYDLKDKKPSIYFDYAFDRYLPTIQISGYYHKGKIQGSLFNTFQFRKISQYQDLSLGYLFNKDQYPLSGINFSYGFSNAQIYPYSISPEQGRSVRLSVYHYPKLFASAYNLTQFNIKARNYLNLPFRHHIMMLSADLGFSLGDTIACNSYILGESNIRGYLGTEIKTQHLLKATAEYRFPLIWIERGLGTLPLFFKNISGAVFYDIGSKYEDRKLKTDKRLMAVGCELNLQTLFFYEIPVNLKIGIASDLTRLSQINRIFFEILPNIPNLNYQ